jgi:hypothetical protein
LRLVRVPSSGFRGSEVQGFKGSASNDIVIDNDIDIDTHAVVAIGVPSPPEPNLSPLDPEPLNP